MAIAFTNESHDIANGAGGPLTMSEPTGTAQGDVLVCVFMITGANTFTPPSGWTTLYSGTSATSNFKYNLSYIVRGASAPNLTWTYNGIPYHECHILGFSGCDTTTPIDAQAQTASHQGVNTNPDPPSVTAVSATTMALGIGINWNGAGGSTWGTSGGYTIRTTNAAGVDVVIATKSLSASGAEDPPAFTGVSTGGSADIWEASITLDAASVVAGLQWLTGVNSP